jgi:hypothetical protein
MILASTGPGRVSRFGWECDVRASILTYAAVEGPTRHPFHALTRYRCGQRRAELKYTPILRPVRCPRTQLARER